MTAPFSTPDPVTLAAELVRCPSVTPAEAGALTLLETQLSKAGFSCHWVNRGEVRNLFARWGEKGHAKTFGFNGHTDVVPIGTASEWSVEPFGGTEADGRLWGRGAVDMKSGVAAFVSAAIDFVEATPPQGALILAITGDEEGDAVDGTAALLDWMEAEGEAMQLCLVGEPTSRETLGDTIKIGRRGSLNVWFEAKGVQGHSAYLHRTKNPVAAVATLAHRLASIQLDDGTEHFDPTTISLATIDTGNPVTNVVPATCSAAVNIRFNDRHTGASLLEWLRAEAARVTSETGVEISLRSKLSGEAFLTPPGLLSELISRAVEAETGQIPELTTGGGTSDARFVMRHCPVAEFGLTGVSMHQVDEYAEIDEIRALTRIYGRILREYFA
ncbi:MAG: succinyl-diaminopimelate desuccinylase [Pseudomonadota bacterium]